MKFDFDTLSTVPAAPPADGADRALDAPPPVPLPPPEPLARTTADAVAEGTARLTESPVAAHINAAAGIHRPLRLEPDRRHFGPQPGRVSGELVAW